MISLTPRGVFPQRFPSRELAEDAGIPRIAVRVPGFTYMRPLLYRYSSDALSHCWRRDLSCRTSSGSTTLPSSPLTYVRLLRQAVQCPHLPGLRSGWKELGTPSRSAARCSAARNEVELVAPRPTIRGADLCLRWSGSIDNAAGLLNKYEILIIDGPARRVTPTGLPALSPTSGIRVATYWSSWRWMEPRLMPRFNQMGPLRCPAPPRLNGHGRAAGGPLGSLIVSKHC
jgi:hypothetical protein